ncbi:MAG: hypothetical protein HFI64_15140 [Lachnospiraceae bacterium]|nr:hypothetical protein [Lachnospiraceae bacterium]
MKYEEIYLINERLTAVTDSLMQKKLPMKLTLPLTDNMRQISAAMSDWRERYTTLLERYAKKGEDGSYDVLPEFQEEYTDEVSSLMDYELKESAVNLSKIPKSLLDYDDSRFDPLTAKELLSIQFMIDGETVTDKEAP